MRYMFIVSGPESFAESGPPPAELHEAVGTLIEAAMREGKLVSFGGLKPTSAGARVRIANGKLVTTDGPFAEAKEVIGGFSIYNFASKEEALDDVQRFMALHHELLPNWQGQVELREMYEQEDDVRETQIEGSRSLEQSRP